MVDSLTDHLIILLNTVHNIRSCVFNEITRFNDKTLYRKSDETLMKFHSSVAGSEVDKLMNDAKSAPEVNFVVTKNDENLLHQKKESKILEEADFSGRKKNDVLKTLKLKLEDSLRFVEALKQNVTEQITVVNNERNSFQSKQNDEINSVTKDISNKNSTKENVGSETIFRNDESDILNMVKSEPLETFGKNHENVMISLISDNDESDSDCIEISITGSNTDNTNVNNPSINSDQFVSVKLENISNFQNNYSTPTTSNQINESVAEEQCNKRRLDEHEKPAKKKKKSKDRNASLVNLFGEFYKVKLSNLSAGITYEEIASLLQNSGLEFLDILLLNGVEKSVAEISFADIEMKEYLMMLTPEVAKLRSYDYQELINELCVSCSYNLNSRGIQLLEETASAISLAIEKLTELEQFIANSKKVNPNEKECSPKEETDSSLTSDIAVESMEHSFKEALLNNSIYFCINENVAENHIVEALNKAGISNFVIDKLVNRINFAYGFLSFKDEDSYQRVTLTNEIFVGSSILRIIPRKRPARDENSERQKRRKKQKPSFTSKKS